MKLKNKRVIFGIAIIIILLIVVSGLIAINSLNYKPSDIKSCEKDSECIKIKDDCCGCSAGGKATSINKNFKDEYLGDLQKECKNIMCTQVISNDSSCKKDAVCVNNKCVLK